MNFEIKIPRPALQPFIDHYAFVSIGLQNDWSTIARNFRSK